MAPSDDKNNGYNTRYIAWAHPTSYYYTHSNSITRSTSLTPSTPAQGITESLFGSALDSQASGFIITVNMNGRTLYRYKTDYGEYRGSFIKVLMSGFTNIYGCGVTLKNRVRSL